jgi:hypothetical protein
VCGSRLHSGCWAQRAVSRCRGGAHLSRTCMCSSCPRNACRCSSGRSARGHQTQRAQFVCRSATVPAAAALAASGGPHTAYITAPPPSRAHTPRRGRRGRATPSGSGSAVRTRARAHTRTHTHTHTHTHLPWPPPGSSWCLAGLR